MMIVNDNKLVIVLDKVNGTPRVFIDGVEIVGKQDIKFDWKTKDVGSNGLVNFEVNYVESKETEDVGMRTFADGEQLYTEEPLFIKLKDKFERAGFNNRNEHARFKEYTDIKDNTRTEIKSNTLIEGCEGNV
ncbi:hypothetical protein JOC34_000839 [Virgibacillus halotolerans]|uniref:hypothetical protein n=1 Tax=Virgibacillus halotolerans TaxID=1071053 RepID=UPI001960514A|nr:hypothetical protein [Virgibacillus halotolerans]MBM7598482.1 hypothetical protein [Virgibacillus halotolerans]